MNRFEQQLNRIKIFVDAHGNLSDKLAMQEVMETLLEPVASVQDVEEFIASNVPTTCDVMIAGKSRELTLNLIDPDAIIDRKAP